MITTEQKAVRSTFMEFQNSLKQSNNFHQYTIQSDLDAVCIITGINADLFNSVFIQHPKTVSACLNELQKLKQQINLPLTAWTTHGITSQEIERYLKNNCKSPGTFFGMSLEISEAKLSPYPQEITIEQITNETQANIFAEIFCKVFNMQNNKKDILAWANKQCNVQAPNSINYLAKINNTYAGASSLMIDQHFDLFNTGGLYNACVLPQFRQNGIGLAMAMIEFIRLNDLT